MAERAAPQGPVMVVTRPMRRRRERKRWRRERKRWRRGMGGIRKRRRKERRGGGSEGGE